MTVEKKNPKGDLMKNLISTFALLATVLFSVNSVAAPAPASKEVTIGLSEVFIPGGFSSTTDAYVIVSGMFPNSCYHWTRAEVMHTSKTQHVVRAIADVAQTMCLMVLVPYQREVNLGRLQSGDHTLRFLNGDGTYFEKTMTIE